MSEKYIVEIQQDADIDYSDDIKEALETATSDGSILLLGPFMLLQVTMVEDDSEDP
ncbi:MAG: hypothetical protein HOD92_24090 [Deltaproteobacteria bacterium]|jgi:hypothetical protein|nr:hypothetical protein [Deltaproteobacteria bacterium]